MKCPNCGCELTRTILTPEMVHYAKSVCPDCGTFLKWLPYPHKEEAPFDHLLIAQSDGDYEVNFGKHKGELLTSAMNDDGRYFLNFVFEKFPENVCDAILACADNFGIVLSEGKSSWRDYDN